jgi:chemotaxis protein histidine kinase CheA
MSVESEDEFQKELIEVFVQEAQEWLQQIHVALDELQQGPTPDRHLKLAQTIKVGITNMGGSAATIGLHEVEQASFSAVPFVEAVQNPAAKITADDFLALCKQLGHIHTSLTHATGVTFQTDGASDHADGLPVNVATSDLLAILYRFQKGQTTQGASNRNLLQNVIDQVEGLKKSGIEQCNITSLKEFLDRWSEGEDGFIEAVQAQIPAVIDEIKRLKSGGAGLDQSDERLQATVEQAAQLLSSAQQINASQAATFFMGLHGFLTIVMQRRIVVPAPKYEAVESRLVENLKALQAWVEAGRAERSAIGAILPN